MNPLNNSRGQVAVLYALLIPIFLFMGGVGLDLGWYYLNVSRLQNAADASVLAGADKLIETNTDAFKGYKVKLVDKYPADNHANTMKSTSTINMTAGNAVALEYAKKNLEDNSTAYAPPNLFSVAQAADDDPIKDGYTRGDNTVDMTTGLYQDGEDYFYVVGLSEDIHHFFIGFLDDMNAGVVSVALISKNIDDSGGGGSSSSGGDNIEITFNPRGGTFNDGSSANVTKTYKNPATLTEEDDPQLITTDKGKPTRSDANFVGWSYTNPDDVEDYTKINIYYEGDTLTEERLKKIKENGGVLYAVYDPIDKVIPHNNKTLWEQMQYLIAKNVYDQSWDVSTSKYSGAGTLIHNSFRDCSNIYLNNYHYYTEKVDMGEYDEQRYWASPTYRKIGEQTHYFLDFLRNGTIKDGNTNIGIPKYGFTYDSRYRTHSLVNVNTRYAVRKGYNDDPLYCNFEGEPYVGDATPIRQIVININVSNLDDQYRPLFFYYEGPDARQKKGDRVSILRPDLAQPVILNLNADFKGVLWMPDVPVVINGNGYTFEGFIVAKEYRYLDTSQGTQVRYKSDGTILTSSRQTSGNKIHVNTSNGNVYSKVATGANALATYNSYAVSTFNLNPASKFRTFEVDTDVKFMYVFYDNNKTMDETPFHEYADLDKDLIPMYKLDDAGNQIRVTKWEDVKLYDSNDFATRKEIPKQLTDDKSIRTVRLDSNGNPAPLYDEAGNPVYFCEDYVKLTRTRTYEVLTLDRVADGTRDPKEFLLTKTDNLNVSDTDDWK